jgi:outer membrane protein TolC
MSPRLSPTLLAALLLAACAVGPNYPRPPLSPAAGYGPLPQSDSETARLAPGGEVAADWWRIYHSQALDALVA